MLSFCTLMGPCWMTTANLCMQRHLLEGRWLTPVFLKINTTHSSSYVVEHTCLAIIYPESQCKIIVLLQLILDLMSHFRVLL